MDTQHIDPFAVLRVRQERLEAERASLTTRLAEIDRELRDLDTTERVLLGLAADGSADDKSKPKAIGHYSSRVVSRLHRRLAGPQFKEIVLEVLRDAYPEELKAAEIQRRSATRFGVGINPNTLTASLARFRDEGLVVLANKCWSYVPVSQDTDRGATATGLR